MSNTWCVLLSFRLWLVSLVVTVVEAPWLLHICSCPVHFSFPCRMYMDCHLMVTNPMDYVDEFVKAGASGFTFHVEVSKGWCCNQVLNRDRDSKSYNAWIWNPMNFYCILGTIFWLYLEVAGALSDQFLSWRGSCGADNWQELVHKIKAGGMRAGVALRPGTPIEEVFPLVREVTKSIMLTISKVVCFVCKLIVWETFQVWVLCVPISCAFLVLPHVLKNFHWMQVESEEPVDMVLVMTVEPGFGGQSFMPETMPKVLRPLPYL